MERQERKYSCGAAALRSALYILGHNLSESALRRRTGTTSEGVGEIGIRKAAGFYGHNTKEHTFNSSKKAWASLKYSINKGRSVLICADSWEHWISVVGIFGGKVIIFDPYKENGKRNKYSGLKVYNEKDLMGRWLCVEDSKNIYYSISIAP